MNSFKTILFLIAIPGSILIVIPATMIQPIEKNAIALGIFSWLALPFWASVDRAAKTLYLERWVSGGWGMLCVDFAIQASRTDFRRQWVSA